MGNEVVSLLDRAPVAKRKRHRLGVAHRDLIFVFQASIAPPGSPAR